MINITKKKNSSANANSDNMPLVPFSSINNSAWKTFGNPAKIPTIIIREIPFPIPCSVIFSPSHNNNIVPVVIQTTAVNLNINPLFNTTSIPPGDTKVSNKKTIPTDWTKAKTTVPYLVIWVIFALPLSPSLANLWKYGRVVCKIWIIIETDM